MHCSFTFPEEVPRPYPSEDATALQKLVEESQDYDEEGQMPDLTLEEKEEALEPHLEEMDADEALEFEKSNRMNGRDSPKYRGPRSRRTS